MEHGEIWSTQVLSAKPLQSLQPFQAIIDGQINIIDEVEDANVRAEFSCPSCSEEFDSSVLYAPLEDEHNVEPKNVTCPICASKIVKDVVIGQIARHGPYFKMHQRRKFKKAGAPSNTTLSSLVKELDETNLGELFETTSQIGSLIANPIDPLCATLVYNIPITDIINAPIPTLTIFEKVVPKKATQSLSQQLKPSVDILLTGDEQKEKEKEGEKRAKFVQELVLSTLVPHM